MATMRGAALFMSATLSGVQALNNGLGLTPPMGYNAYNHVGCCANETSMKAAGAALVSLGWHKLGYEYVNMDCGWMGGRRACPALLAPALVGRGARAQTREASAAVCWRVRCVVFSSLFV